MAALAQLKLESFGLLALGLGVSAIFIALGMWQLDRAGQKRVALTEFETRGVAAQIDLNASIDGDGGTLSGYRAAARGRYLFPYILLDNQLQQGRAGYLVYSVFEIEGRSQSVLINHGWIPAPGDRRQVPEFATALGNRQLEGRLSQSPAMGLALDGSDLIERLTDTMWRVQTIDFAALSREIAVDLLRVTLRLDEDDASPDFIRAWTPPASDEARHRAYAMQWFAMAITVVIIMTVLVPRSGKARIS